MALTPERTCAEGRCEETIGLLEESVLRRPADFRLHYWLGICYGGKCRAHALVHPAMAIPYLRQALRLTPPGAAARAAVVDQFANTVIQAGIAPRDAALRLAIDSHSEAGELYRALDMPDEWARVQFNLGNSFCELSEIAGENHWPEAIARYELALQVRTRENDPERYAAAMENLGTAYRRLPPPDTARGLRMCVYCYRRALAVYTPAGYPERNATVQNNLGNAYLTLAATEAPYAARHLRRALRHFERALRIQSANPHSRAFGITQYNRAQAYVRLSNLPLANACLDAAAAAFDACAEERYSQLVRSLLASLKLPPSPLPASHLRAGS